jgi:hypothetical protein
MRSNVTFKQWDSTVLFIYKLTFTLHAYMQNTKYMESNILPYSLTHSV